MSEQQAKTEPAVSNRRGARRAHAISMQNVIVLGRRRDTVEASVLKASRHLTVVEPSGAQPENIVLFRAERDGQRFAVVLASDIGILPPYRLCVAGALPEAIECWNMTEIRNDIGGQSTVHVLGWREQAGGKFITPALAVFDAANQTVYTDQGNAYRLVAEGTGHSAGLCEYLSSILHIQGFDLVAG